MKVKEGLNRVVAGVSVVLLAMSPGAPASGRAPQSAVIEGAIVGAEGNSIPGAQMLLLSLDDGSEYASPPTGPEGFYRVAGLASGRYEAAIRTDRGVYLVGPTIHVSADGRQTCSFRLKDSAPERAREEARSSRAEQEKEQGTEQEKESQPARKKSPKDPSKSRKSGTWSNPLTVVLAGVAVAIGAGVIIQGTTQEDDDGSPDRP